MTTYSGAYLEGIKDARATLKFEGMDRLEQVAGEELAFLDRLCGCAYSAHSEETSDYIRGLRDFWNWQLRRAA